MYESSFFIKTHSQIAEIICGEILKINEKRPPASISIDSRKMEKDCVFIALKGENFDGHDYIEKAIENGASCIVLEKNKKEIIKDTYNITLIAVDDTIEALGKLAQYNIKNLDITIIGITGSVGKTSTREILKSILSKKYRVLSPEKNFNNHIGVPLTLLRAKKEHDFAIIEMGMSNKGEIEYLSKMSEPDVAIITKIGPAHIESFADINEIACEKAGISKGMKENSPIIINHEDKILKNYLGKNTILTFGKSEDANLYFSDINISSKSSSARFTYKNQGLISKFDVTAKITGETAIKNSAAAALTAIISSVDTKTIKTGISSYEGVKGRFHRIYDPEKSITIIDDTYNSNPESLKASLTDFRTIKKSNRGFVVLGDMLELGKDSKKYHIEAGKQAIKAKIAGIFSYGTFSNFIAEGALKESCNDEIIFCGTHEEISSRLNEILKAGDWVMVKGSRGAQMERVLNSLTERQVS